MTEQEQREKVVAEALSWRGTPYHHRGAVKGAGIDCGGFLFEVFSRVGLIEHREVPPYPRDFYLHRSDEWYLTILLEYCEETLLPQPGDIVMFRFGRVMAHAGIVTEYPQIIHAHSTHGVMIDDLEQNTNLNKRVMGAFSYWKKGR